MIGAKKAARGRYRDGRRRPTFDTPIVLRRLGNSLKYQRGTQDLEADFIYAVKASYDRPSLPATAPPTGHGAPPLDDSGWKGFWPPPPSPLPAGYLIPDPPDIEPPAETTAEAPLLWRIEATLGGAWSAPEIFELRLFADVRPQSGSERDQGGELVSTTLSSFRVQAANIGRITEDPETLPSDWQLRRDGRAWNIRSALETWNRAYIDLKAERKR